MQVSIKRSVRAKYMRLRVAPGGVATLTVPVSVRQGVIDKFLAQHDGWLMRATARMANLQTLPVRGRRAYLAHREEARARIASRLEYWNRSYGFSYRRISIKNQKSMWGSCSKKGNLNFSYALLFLPPTLADYVIVHELCHLKEHNHSPRFWALVALSLPDYLDRRRSLRKFVLPH